jgi:hypothetical protein
VDLLEQRQVRAAQRSVRGKPMDPWRHCPNFSDAVLDAFIKGFPLHPDHSKAVAEFERRREEREQGIQARGHQAEREFGPQSILTWTIGRIASVRLRVSKHRRLAA